MGTFPSLLTSELRDRLALERAIETGAYRGDGLRALAKLFPSATSIEISPAMAAVAQGAVSQLSNARVVTGDSRTELPKLVDASRPTLYWLDGHWSGGATGGRDDECPVLAELAAVAAGHADDCIFIDDARLFPAPPPAPHDPLGWPSFMEIYEQLLAARPESFVTILDDVVIAVPARARPVVDAYARPSSQGPRWSGLAHRIVSGVSGRIRARRSS